MSRKSSPDYVLEDQIGHILRRANQRHTEIFFALMPPDLTPTRLAAMAKLLEKKSLSQNELGRLTAMDVATIKGVIDRLQDRNLIRKKKDPNDARRQLIELTEKGRQMLQNSLPLANEVTSKTVAPLSQAEADQLVALLKKIS